MPATAYVQLVNRALPPLEKGCTSKAGFVSRSEAQQIARHGRHADGTTRPYRCTNCTLWHLGHRRRRR